jgi:hypothetical protein
MADHLQYRNGPHRSQRLIKAERHLTNEVWGRNVSRET